MRAALALLLVLASAVPAAAADARPPVVRLVACDTTARTADFEGDMSTLPGAARLQMRFSVEVRADDGGWDHVQAKNLDTWVSALPGRTRYVYDKHVEGLQPGVATRVAVRFRWRDATGRVLRTVTRRSRPCKVPDPRADLSPVAIDVLPGADATGRTYVLTVANRGRSAAPATAASFEVAGQVLPDQPVPALAPGARMQVQFAGPACAAGAPLVAGVDATGLVDEATETDDVLTVPCPGS